MIFTSAGWSSHDRQRCPHPDTFLVLTHELSLASTPKVPHPPALPTQGGGSDLGTGRMSETFFPINLESKMVICMYHFCRVSITWLSSGGGCFRTVSEGIFHMLPILQRVCTYLYTIIGVKTSTLHLVTSCTADIIGIDVSTEVVDLFAHKPNDRTYFD